MTPTLHAHKAARSIGRPEAAAEIEKIVAEWRRMATERAALAALAKVEQPE